MPSIHEPEIFNKVKKLVDFYYYKFSIREPQDDVFHDIVLSLMSTMYIERFDDSKPIHNYLSGFIYNHFCKAYKREGYAVNQAQGLEVSLTEDGDFTLLSTIDSASNVDPDDSIELEAILNLLEEKFPPHTFLVYDNNLRLFGIFSKDDVLDFDFPYFIVYRSVGQVFRLLYEGLSQTEIKDLLLVSKAWVSKIVSRIVSLEELQNFAKSKGFKI